MPNVLRFSAKGLFALAFLLASYAFAQPGPAVQYTDEVGHSLTLYPWAGKKVVLLTASNTLDVPTMNAMVAGADAGWVVYEQIAGQDPESWSNGPFPGMDVIAEVPDADACGAECSYLGAMGTDIGTSYFNNYVYSDMFNQDTYDQALFYEFGRNFWFYYPQMQPIDAFVTGFAIANRFISMDRAGLPGGPFGSLTYAGFEQSDMINLLNSYLADSNYNWQNTLVDVNGPVLNKTENPNGWGPADLAGAMYYRIYTDNGFQVYSSFWQNGNHAAGYDGRCGGCQFPFSSVGVYGPRLHLSCEEHWSGLHIFARFLQRELLRCRRHRFNQRNRAGRVRLDRYRGPQLD